MQKLSRSYRVLLVLAALDAICACRGQELLGMTCPDPHEACAGKRCGDACRACSAGSSTTADLVGYCGADGVCTSNAPSCSMVDGGAQGCGRPGAAAGVQTGQTLTVAGQARTYVLSVPTDYTGASPLALVIVWHGANLTGSLARTLFNLESKSSGAAIFVYPDGLPQNGGMTGWDLSTGSADFQLFESLVASLSSNYCIDSNRIFTTGHSTGAVMANNLGCFYGDVLRAVAPVAGTPPILKGTAPCTGKVAAWIAHGENDTTVPLSQGEATRDFWVKQDGCTTQASTWAPEPACVAYQGCQTDLPVVWCVHDGGHSWPSLNFGCDGGVCFDGGSAIWAFFSSFH